MILYVCGLELLMYFIIKTKLLLPIIITFRARYSFLKICRTTNLIIIRSNNKKINDSPIAIKAIILTGNTLSPLKKSYTMRDDTESTAANANLPLSGNLVRPKKIDFLYNPNAAKIINIIGTKHTIVKVKSRSCDSNSYGLGSTCTRIKYAAAKESISATASPTIKQNLRIESDFFCIL